MLTPEQIQEARKKLGLSNEGIPVVNAPVLTGKSLLDKLQGKAPSTPSLGSRIFTDIKKRGENVVDTIAGNTEESKGEPALVRSVQATKEAFGGAVDVGGELLKSLGSHFRTPEQALAEQKKKDPNAKPAPTLEVPNVVKDTASKVNEVLGTKLNEWATKHPEASKALESTLKIAKAGGEIAGTIAAADVGALGANKLPVLGEEASAQGVKNVVEQGKNLVTKTGEKIAVVDNTLGKIRGVVPTAEEKITNKAFEAITPKVENITPKDYGKLLEQKRILPKTTTEPAKYLLSDTEKATAAKYQNILQNKDPVKNSINVMNEIASKDTQVGEFLAKNNNIFNNGELKNFISNKLKGVSDIAIPQSRVTKQVKTMVDNFVSELPKNDMKSLWEARKAFDSKIESAFGGSPTLSNQLKRGFRNSVQEFIGERTPDTIYKGFMKEMTNLYGLNDNILLNASKQRGLTGFLNWVKENPTKAKVLGLVGVATLGSGVYGTAHAFGE